GAPDVPQQPWTPQVLLDHVTAVSLWLDGDYVYFENQALGVGRIPKTGGAMTTYSTDRTSFHVTTADTYVYWTNDCCVSRKPKTNQGLGDVFGGPANSYLEALVVDATSVYFV